MINQTDKKAYYEEKYIDAEWLKAFFKTDKGKNRMTPIDNLLALIDDAPSINIVRCGECKHNPKYTDDYMYGRCIFCCEDDFYAGTPSDDFYCGHGEREGE